MHLDGNDERLASVVYRGIAIDPLLARSRGLHLGGQPPSAQLEPRRYPVARSFSIGSADRTDSTAGANT